MAQKSQWAVPFAIAFVWLISPMTATAQLPSALVLEKQGTTRPEVKPYTEVSVGRTITLSPRSKIVFQHYYSCRTVTVVGGTVEFETKAYFVKGGKKEKETNSPCPKTVTLKAGGEAGGVLMRSMLSRSDLTFSSRPQFVLVGKRAGGFASVHVSRGDRVILKSPLSTRYFQWPSRSKPLAVGEIYELTLIPADSNSTPLKQSFKVAPANPGSDGILLIRVD